ncbi:uncharacterized protein LOC141703684 [Apium graveolens]|uniref:uncharacterized protein LOC141703684 n=1 Tax=Apium graveolens TaxID=4045 RepID=UPI003D79CE9B
MLLLCNKVATSFRDLRTINGRIYNTYKEAYEALGLLKDDNQWHSTLRENAESGMPFQLRSMFVHILTNCPVADPLKLWTDNWKFLSHDILYNKRKKSGNVELKLSDADLENYKLAEVEKLLNGVGKSLKDFPNMPYPEDIYMHSTTNRLIEEETRYDKNQQFEEHSKNFQSLNSEQLEVYNSVLEALNKGEGGLFFVYGSGGCGKTFLWKTLCRRLRSEGKIVLLVASSGIAATLLPNCRTSHSRFHIPLKLDRYSVAGIKHGCDIVELIKNTSLVIWDEAPMQHRHAFKSVDRCFLDAMASVHPRNKNILFGGITIIFGGFSANLACYSKVFVLHQNMHLGCGRNVEENQKIAEFSKWVLDVGDGKVQNIHPDNIYKDPEIIIPRKYLVEKKTNAVKDIVDVTYPDFMKNYTSMTHSYLSQDFIDTETVNDDNDYESSFPIKYLKSINIPSILKHDLKLKVGVVVMLMKNLNQIMGLCNGTRMVLTKCLKNNVECQLLTGSHAGTKLYVAVSRVTSPDGLHILIDSDNGKTCNFTANDLLNHSQNMFHQLSTLNTSSTAWRVKVRVTRMWSSLSSTDTLKAYNLIFLDAHISLGVVEDFERVKSIKTIYDDKDIVQFLITDRRYLYMVSVWADMAKDIDR